MTNSLKPGTVPGGNQDLKRLRIEAIWIKSLSLYMLIIIILVIVVSSIIFLYAVVNNIAGLRGVIRYAINFPMVGICCFFYRMYIASRDHLLKLVEVELTFRTGNGNKLVTANKNGVDEGE